jgi:hypothetical protein
MGVAAGMVEVVGSGSSGARKPIPRKEDRSRCHHGLRHRRRPLTSPQTNKPQRQTKKKCRDDGEPGLPPRSRAPRRGRRFKEIRGSCARGRGARRAEPVAAIPVAHSLRIRWIGIPSRWCAVLSAHDRFRNARAARRHPATSQTLGRYHRSVSPATLAQLRESEQLLP